MSSLKATFKGLLGSKKAMMAFVSSGVWIAGRFGFEVNAAELLPVVSPLWGYIIAQAGADWGKEKALIDKEPVAAPASTLAPAEG